MNEIKFRAWSKTIKEMTPSVTLKALVLGGTETERKILSRNWNDLIFMHNTGLKDMKGTEIYEGDILANKSDATVIVAWDNEYACFDCEDIKSGNSYGLLGNCEPQSYKIIGNIYENPKLLK